MKVIYHLVHILIRVIKMLSEQLNDALTNLFDLNRNELKVLAERVKVMLYEHPKKTSLTNDGSDIILAFASKYVIEERHQDTDDWIYYKYDSKLLLKNRKELSFAMIDTKVTPVLSYDEFVENLYVIEPEEINVKELQIQVYGGATEADFIFGSGFTDIKAIKEFSTSNRQPEVILSSINGEVDVTDIDPNYLTASGAPLCLNLGSIGKYDIYYVKRNQSASLLLSIGNEIDEQIILNIGPSEVRFRYYKNCLMILSDMICAILHFV